MFPDTIVITPIWQRVTGIWFREGRSAAYRNRKLKCLTHGSGTMKETEGWGLFCFPSNSLNQMYFLKWYL